MKRVEPRLPAVGADSSANGGGIGRGRIAAGIAPTAARAGPGSSRGFSLIEVVVALAILALALGSLMQLFGAAARSATLTGERNQALALAESRLALLSAETVLTEGESSGTFDEKYRWRVRVAPFEEDAAEERRPLRPLLVSVAVSWGEGAVERRLSLTGVRLVTVR